MTTIAWDGTTLAADTRGVCGTLPLRTQKIWRLPDGRLYGGSGQAQDVLAVWEWLSQGESKQAKPTLDQHEGFAAILVTPAGLVYRLETALMAMPILEPYHAVGSGRDFALMAMHLGKTAQEAVALAAVFDVYTGGAVETLTLPPRRTRKAGRDFPSSTS